MEAEIKKIKKKNQLLKTKNETPVMVSYQFQ